MALNCRAHGTVKLSEGQMKKLIANLGAKFKKAHGRNRDCAPHFSYILNKEHGW